MILVTVISPPAEPVLDYLQGQTVSHRSVRERDSDALLADLAEAARITDAGALLIDAGAGPRPVLRQALRYYRAARPRVRIILLAPAAELHDPVLVELARIGITEVVTESEPEAAAAAVQRMLDNPPAPAESVARWLTSEVKARPAQKAPGRPARRWAAYLIPAALLVIAVGYGLEAGQPAPAPVAAAITEVNTPASVPLPVANPLPEPEEQSMTIVPTVTAAAQADAPAPTVRPADRRPAAPAAAQPAPAMAPPASRERASYLAEARRIAAERGKDVGSLTVKDLVKGGMEPAAAVKAISEIADELMKGTR